MKDSRSVVAPRLGREEMPQMGRDVLVGKLSSDDGLSENLRTIERQSVSAV